MTETERLIRNITDASVGLISGASHQPLLRAIDAAMSHAYAEGRADERKDWIEQALAAGWPGNLAREA